MRKLSILLIILLISVVVPLDFFDMEVNGELFGGEVKFRGVVATDERWGDFVCYGSYYCDVIIEEILYDPNNTLLLGYNVSVCYGQSLTLKVGDRVESYGFYYKWGGPLQCIGYVCCNEDPYYVSLSIPAGPKAEFAAIPVTALTGESIKFDALASLPGWNGTHEMPIVEYRWDFGDGNRTTTSTPIVYHSFSSSGIYYVTLTVYAPGATPETDSTTYKVTVISIPVGGYSVPIKGYTAEKPLTPYLALVAILTAAFTAIKRKIQRRTKHS